MCPSKKRRGTPAAAVSIESLIAQFFFHLLSEMAPFFDENRLTSFRKKTLDREEKLFIRQNFQNFFQKGNGLKIPQLN